MGGDTDEGDSNQGGDSGDGDGNNDKSSDSMPKGAPLTTGALTAGRNSDNDDGDDDSGRDNGDDDDNEPASKDAPVTTDALTAKKIECPKGQEVSLFSTSCKPAGTDQDAPASKTIDVPGGGKITYTYHPNGKIASETFDLPGGSKWSNTWNPDGKKTAETSTDPNGRKTTYTNEPYTITIEVPGYSKITTVYGPQGKSETMTFSGGKGQIIAYTDYTGEKTHTTYYDSDGHWHITFPEKPDGTIKTYFENGTSVVTDQFGKELRRWND